MRFPFNFSVASFEAHTAAGREAVGHACEPLNERPGIETFLDRRSLGMSLARASLLRWFQKKKQTHEFGGGGPILVHPCGASLALKGGIFVWMGFQDTFGLVRLSLALDSPGFPILPIWVGFISPPLWVGLK